MKTLNLSNRSDRIKYAQRVTIIGSIADTILGILKVIIGWLFHSHALVIDGIHSFTDVFSDIFVVVITKISHSGPDDNHPYGHEKFETIGSTALGSILIATGGALIYETITSLLSGETPPIPGWPTLIVAALSLIVKEGLYHYTYRAGEKLQSNLIKANAWHSRTDAFSSLVVLIGLTFASFGLTYVDSIAALVVALIITKIGWKFVKESIVELAETSAEPAVEEKIKDVILAVEGVQSCHALRTRKMGPKVIVDVNVEVSTYLTASEGHEISAWVIKRLKETISEVEDVTVHMDVEDDQDHDNEELYAHSFDDLLPLRSHILKELESVWEGFPVLKDANHVRLHYIKRKVIPELILPLENTKSQDYQNIKELESQLDKKADHLPWYGKVSILFGDVGF